MLNILKQIGRILLILLFCSPAWAATYTTSKAGTDAASCVASPPTTDCLTIQYVLNNANLAPGDTFYVRAGTYAETVAWGSDDIGDGTGQVFFKAYPGESVIITGSGGGTVPLSLDSRSYITVDGIRVTNSTTNCVSVNITQHVTLQNMEIDNCEDGISGIPWSSGLQNLTNLTIDSNSIHDNTVYGISLNTGNGGYLTNNVLITNNSIYDNVSGIRLAPLAVQNSYRFSAITISNNKVYSNKLYGLILIGIDDSISSLVLNGNKIYDNGDTPGAAAASGLWMADVRTGSVYENILYNNNTGTIEGIGIYLDHAGYTATGWEDDGANIWYKASIGAKPDRVKFDDVYGVEESTKVGLSAAQEWFYDADADILYVYPLADEDPDTAYTAMYLMWCSNNISVYRNLTYNHDSTLTEEPYGAGTTFNSSGLGVCCGAFSNTIHNNIAYGNAVGLSLDGVATNNNFFNNTFSANRIGVFHDMRTEGTGNTFTNNIIAINTKVGDGETTYWDIYKKDAGDPDIAETYSVFGASPSFEEHTADITSIELDPLFTNAASGDFRLLPQSPAIDAGVWLSHMIKGTWRDFYQRQHIFGANPDIGAAEAFQWKYISGMGGIRYQVPWVSIWKTP